MKVFLCTEEAENILTAIYDAWADKTPNKDCSIQVGEVKQPELFSEYIYVTTDENKVAKVVRSIKTKLGASVWRYVESGLLASAKNRADIVFRFLIYAFIKGKNVTEELSIPVVMDMFELDRATRNEAHYFIEFTRFEQLENGSFFAEIEPKAQVLPFIIHHFAERLNTERFMIYDHTHSSAAVYTPETEWYFLKGEELSGTVISESPSEQNVVQISGDISEEGSMREKNSSYVVSHKKDIYVDLWKIFFDTIAIRERTNPKCQQNHCPLHFRKYMTEFMGK